MKNNIFNSLKTGSESACLVYKDNWFHSVEAANANLLQPYKLTWLDCKKLNRCADYRTNWK